MDRLPNELLAEIREVFPLSDLIFHVRFYQVSERAAMFYHSDDKFWFQLCRINGLGCFHDEHPDSLDWQQVAFDCERHARTCQHPGCGAMRLSENGMYLRPYCLCPLIYSIYAVINMQKIHPGLCGEMCCAATMNAVQLGDIVSSTGFSHIAFKYTAEGGSGSYAAYLRPLDQDLAQTPPPDIMDDHNIASRTFATFPPVENMRVNVFNGSETSLPVQNASGVTTRDLQSCIARE